MWAEQMQGIICPLLSFWGCLMVRGMSDVGFLLCESRWLHEEAVQYNFVWGRGKAAGTLGAPGLHKQEQKKIRQNTQNISCNPEFSWWSVVNKKDHFEERGDIFH